MKIEKIGKGIEKGIEKGIGESIGERIQKIEDLNRRLQKIYQQAALVLVMTFSLFSLAALSSCASDGPPMPCPHFGLFCSKTPINSWTNEGNSQGNNNA